MLSKEIQVLVDIKNAEKENLKKSECPRPLRNLIPEVIYKGLFIYQTEIIAKKG